MEIIDTASTVWSGIQFANWGLEKLFGSSYTNIRNAVVNGVQNAAREAGSRFMENLRGLGGDQRYAQLTEVAENSDDIMKVANKADDLERLANKADDIMEVANESSTLSDIASGAKTVSNVASTFGNLMSAGADIAEVATGFKQMKFALIGLAGLAGVAALLALVDANSDEFPKGRIFRESTLKRLF